MIAIGTATRIFLAVGATDMRKGFDGLADLCRHVLEVDPLSGHLCVFCNRRRTRIKILYWDGSGLWMCAKRLERGTFRWPTANDNNRKIAFSSEELALLLGGLDIGQARKRKWWRRAAPPARRSTSSISL